MAPDTFFFGDLIDRSQGAMDPLPPDLAGALVSRLALPIFVFRRGRVVYRNEAARTLVERIHKNFGTDIEIMLQGHLDSFRHAGGHAGRVIVTLLTAPSGEPFYVHILPLGDARTEIAVTVRT